MWEKLADKFPAVTARALSLNGFGFRYLDFHDRRDDGSFAATLWLTAAFLPVGALRRERVRLLGRETKRGVPFVLRGTSVSMERLERLSLDASRNLRLYAFYFAAFVPLAVGPVVAGFVLLVLRDFHVSAGQFWGAAFLVFAWGVACVFLERRVMGPPRAHA